MTKTLTSYLAVLVIFVSIDLVWLAIVARGTYVREIGGLLAAQPGLIAAALFYLMYAAGLMFFAVNPALAAGSIGQAFLLGAAAGLFAYGTYDLTNLSVVKGFTTRIALIDMAWGTLLSAATSALAYIIISRIWPSTG
jgi:uncharacterized membrane protein